MKHEQPSTAASLEGGLPLGEPAQPFLAGTFLAGAMLLAVVGVGVLSMVAVRSLRAQINTAQGEVSQVEQRIEGLKLSAVEASDLLDQVRDLHGEVQVLETEGHELRQERDVLLQREVDLTSALEASRRVERELRSEVERVRAEKSVVEGLLTEREDRISRLQGRVGALATQRNQLAQRVAQGEDELERVSRQRDDLLANLAFERAVVEARQQACDRPGVAGHRRCVDEVQDAMGRLRSAYMACASGGDRPWVKTLDRDASAPGTWRAIHNRTYLALCNPDLPRDGAS
ncbi:MAG TPA: hypothetical protein ENK18_01405 [Deltaproteobacteria bacterium]|nr:hypothetical protein [Deltaproteobacteria bacterium]